MGEYRHALDMYCNTKGQSRSTKAICKDAYGMRRARFATVSIICNSAYGTLRIIEVEIRNKYREREKEEEGEWQEKTDREIICV